MTTTIRLADKSGIGSKNTRVDRFLGEWLADGSAVSCFRDQQFGLLSTSGSLFSNNLRLMTPPVMGGYAAAERATYLSSGRTAVWLERTQTTTVLKTPNGAIGEIDNRLPTNDLVIPSPNGQYLAIAGTIAGNHFHLWVYDVNLHTSNDLGEVTIHPDPNWDYLKPSWNPWFRDSSHLTYFSEDVLFVATPDGRERRRIGEIANAGLPVPSADGTRVAYVTFTPRPLKLRPDLRFWGDAVVWIVDSQDGKAVAVTKATSDTIFDLRWLDGSTLLFDRISDEPFYRHARIWAVSLKQRE